LGIPLVSNIWKIESRIVLIPFLGAFQISGCSEVSFFAILHDLSNASSDLRNAPLPSDRKRVIINHFWISYISFCGLLFELELLKKKLDIRKWLPTILLLRRTVTVPVRAQSQEWIEGMPGTRHLVLEDSIYMNI
jgi:hypothetical protein